MPKEPEIRVIRSARRRRTIQARRVGGVIEVRIPDALSPAEEAEAVAGIVAKVRSQEVAAPISDAALLARARRLNASVLESRARVQSVRWVSNQTTRWGSCTQATGAIRISDRLREVPDYVLDAVLVHELVHTFVPGGHTAEFWSWAERAPRAERARGYLEAYGRYAGD
ncbi:metal-dependent hydrolase [Corynebacterium atypicum]|uniref:Metal-dependent hydrolase n=1 Tax=Corynebacterium atypicum TaxID=191610 RepID=A0ABN4DBR5_9CORY|nr:M48 family metallopeptidase [Corynebacterium atypicum]AIG63806.1 metal-dependent hydrolase [Corynebacterium atypicum]